MSGIALYGKPKCTGCDNTERKLKREGLAYTKIDITQDADAYKYVTETLGYSAAPVVVTETKHWSGYRPDLIEEIER